MPFNRAHAKFVGSAAFAQLLPLISAPIVARLYAPSDFGIYAIFIALATILASISSLSLNNAIVLETKGIQSFHATILGLGLVGLSSCLLMVLILGVPHAWQAAVLGEFVVPYLPWLPLTVLLQGSFQCLYNWAVKDERFAVLAKNKLILAGITMFLQIAIGLMDPGPIGFVVANFLGIAAALGLIGWLFLVARATSGYKISFSASRVILCKHRRLIFWTMPATLVTTLSSMLPDLLIGRLFGVAQSGQYLLANRVVHFPVTFVATSAQDIFRQQATAENEATGMCVASFKRFFLIMVGFSTVLLLPIILVVPLVFPIIFGQQWVEAGYLIQATGVLTVLRFISSPLSYVWIVRGQQRLDFFWQLGLLVVASGAFLLPRVFAPSFPLYSTLWVYGLSVGAWYVLAIFLSYRFARMPDPSAESSSVLSKSETL